MLIGQVGSLKSLRMCAVVDDDSENVSRARGIWKVKGGRGRLYVATKVQSPVNPALTCAHVCNVVVSIL